MSAATNRRAFVFIFGEFRADGRSLRHRLCGGARTRRNARGILGGFTSVAAPPLLTNIFGYFTSPAAPIYIPGAVFFAASLLFALAALLLTRVCAAPIPQPAE